MPIEGEITAPRFERQPDAEVMANYYPKLGQILQMPGLVRLTCKVSAAGALEACVIDKETPSGMGFGGAALSLTQYFKIRPQTIDGVAVAGGSITIPIRFQSPELEILEDPDPNAPPPTAEGLALGRRLYAAIGGPEHTAEQIKTMAGDETATPEAQQALAELQKAMDSEGGDFAETFASTYARAFTIEDLKALVIFLESPVGQAWSRGETLKKAATYAGQKAWLQAISQARNAFCAKNACPTPMHSPPVAAPSPTAGQSARP